jgi:hypothetical protein
LAFVCFVCKWIHEYKALKWSNCFICFLCFSIHFGHCVLTVIDGVVLLWHSSYNLVTVRDLIPQRCHLQIMIGVLMSFFFA